MSANLSNYLINLRSLKIKNIAYRTVKYIESPIRENDIKPKWNHMCRPLWFNVKIQIYYSPDISPVILFTLPDKYLKISGFPCLSVESE